VIKNIFENKKVFKLILGAGNEDIDAIKKLVSIYKKAGANIFDVRADKLLINEVKNTLNNQKETDCYICASIALGDDIHFKKAQITDQCSICKKCIAQCSSNAIIYADNKVKIIKERCIGCQNCAKYCISDAISFLDNSKNYQKVFSEIKDSPVDYIEIHSNGTDKEIYKCFEFLKVNFKGLKGICISENKITDNQKIEIIKNIKQILHPEKLVVQADGTSMSGFDNNEHTTIKALEMSKLFLDNVDDIYVMPSGGTNSKTMPLAKQQDLDINGIAVGSYARKIVSAYLSSDEQKAIELASNFVRTALN
jgi:Fe-S-cluster-containing hydrogenase component 2